LNFRFKTLVVSDLHLGIRSSKAKEVVRFIKNHPAEKIILNGDIIDGWQLKKSGSWKKKHTRFFKLLLKMLSKENVQVIYLRGNHDDFLDEVLPLEIGNFSIRRDYIHESFGKRYYVVHGDIFDSITTKLKWLAHLGDIGYTFLLWINRFYNNYRIRKGLPYYSLSQQIKLKVKKAVSFISDFETELVEVARHKKCHGVITGHIHQPANKMINGIHYLNSGDWVESLSALVETFDGTWEIIYFSDWEKSRELKNNVNAESVLNRINTNLLSIS
jgi:UDP-2,3-diacylglucosamine pyrophosphatase LpxH